MEYSLAAHRVRSVVGRTGEGGAGEGSEGDGPAAARDGEGVPPAAASEKQVTRRLVEPGGLMAGDADLGVGEALPRIPARGEEDGAREA